MDKPVLTFNYEKHFKITISFCQKQTCAKCIKSEKDRSINEFSLALKMTMAF